MNKKDRTKRINKFVKNNKFKDYHILFSDIETIIEDELQQPVVICLLVDYNKFFTFTGNNCVDTYMNYLLTNNRNCIVYFHNFGRFDSTFILRWIAKNKQNAGDVDVIERNNIIYQIKLIKFNIYFRDSYLIIPLKLKQIGETFCERKKIIIDYGNITELYTNNPKKVIDQCINDCEVLKEGFDNFSKLIFETFEIILLNQLTLPTLAFNIFKKNYYDFENNYISKNPYKEDEFIRRSYVGGISEVFKPYLENGYCYDANSLYPTVMMRNKFPVGKGKFVDGSTININDFIGFIECRVKINKELNFLTYKHSEKGLITPIGEWIGVYFHPEIKKAIELGYEIEFIKGFKYEREEYIFKGYVQDLYDMRKNAKNKSMNSIAKLLLNSLYGRFGMKIFGESTKFISVDQLQKIKQSYNVTNIHYIGNGMYTLSVLKKINDSADLYKNSIDTETAVQIASAVTSYSRIYMYNFKNIPGNECYYTDTDSIFVKHKIDQKYIGSELGDFKLEYEFKKAYFIAPKVYYIEFQDKEPKIVIKGLKKDEYDKNDLLTVFKDIIMNKDPRLEIFRVNVFKRDLLQLITYIQKINLTLTFPFNKRVKIIENGVWVGTRPLKIKDTNK